MVLTSPEDIPGDAVEVCAADSGFVQRLDVPAIAECAKEGDAKVFMTVLPGDRVLKGQVIAKVTGDVEPEEIARLVGIGSYRSYDQDTR